MSDIKRLVSEEEKRLYGCIDCKDVIRDKELKCLFCSHEECEYKKDFEGYPSYASYVDATRIKISDEEIEGA